MEERTIDSIISWFERSVRNKDIIDAHMFVEAAADLNILKGDEDDKLYDLQQQVAQQKCLYLEQDCHVSKAKVLVEATDTYKEYCRQHAKIERIEEFIRIAKIQARLKDNNLQGY